MLRDLVIYTPMYVTFFWAVVLLLSSRQKNPAKHFLGFFMFTAFLLYLSHAIFFNDYHALYFYIEPLYTVTSLSVYPIYYWYIKHLTIEPETERGNFFMFIPAMAIGFVSGIIGMLMSPAEKELYIQSYSAVHASVDTGSQLISFQKWVYLAGRVIFAAQVIYFLIYGSKLVVRYNTRIANFYSNLEDKTIVWVKLLLISFVITSVMSVVFNLIGKVFFSDNIWLLLIPSAIFSILLFTIGLQGYMQNHTIRDLEKDEQQSQLNVTKEHNHRILKENLIQLFETDLIYKNPDLKITHISSTLHTNRTYISNLINKEFACTFSDFVNNYRIVEAKKLLLQDTLRKYSLDFISEKSGFGSQSTFIRVFKDREGVTPGKFRDLNIIEESNT